MTYLRRKIMGRRPNTQIDFWDRVQLGSNIRKDCWEWIGGVSRKGYGQMAYEGRMHTAHRLAWTFTKGDIPEGLHVLHKCDNPTCCNPWHLFIGTHQDNMDDMVKKNRAVGKKPNAKRLTDAEVLAIRAMHKAKIKGVIIAECFGVSMTCIEKNITGESHANIQRD
jgi:hypothetical protein